MRMRTKGGPKAKSDHKTQHHRTSSVPRVDLDFALGRVGEGGGRRIHHDGNDMMLSGQCAVTKNRTKTHDNASHTQPTFGRKQHP